MLEKFKNKEKNRIWFILSTLLTINILIILITLLVSAGINNWNFNKAGNYLLNQVYLNNFFKQPALVLGFITLLGYLIMGRSVKDSFLGSLKCVIGYILLSIGSGTLVGVSKPVFESIKNVGNSSTTVVPLDPYLGWTSANSFFENFRLAQNYISLTTYVFIVGFLINIILVALKKWTNVHSLMITGHVMLQQTAIITAAFYILLFSQIPLINNTEISAGSQAGLVIIAGIFLGSYWGIASTGTLKGTNDVTNNAGFAIGHQQMLGISLTYKISKWFGKKENSAETRKMPKALKIFEDNIFVQSFILVILFLILFIILISTGVLKLANNGSTGFVPGDIANQWNTFGGAHWFLNIFGGALKLVAALICMMTGVRMFVTELQQSFTGISEKVIKNAVVAVDIAAVYGFAPNSVTFAFASGTIAQFIGTFVTIGLSFIPGSSIAVIIPLFVTLFFNSGAIGPYANAAGGMKAVIIVPAIIGFIEIIVIALGIWALTYAADNSVASSLTTYQLGKTNDAYMTLDQIKAIFGDKYNNVINYDATKGLLTLNSSFNLSSVTNLGTSYKVHSNWSSNPFQTGYIGMVDWTLFFGSIMLIGGWNIYGAFVVVAIALLIMFVYAQIQDSSKQNKKTWLQNIFKLNVILTSKQTNTNQNNNIEIEDNYDTSNSISKSLKIIAACGNGMGTSMIIKLKVEKICEQLGINANVEAMSAAQAKSMVNSVDIIISSTHLSSEFDKNQKAKIAGVKDLMNENEIKQSLTKVLNQLNTINDKNENKLKIERKIKTKENNEFDFNLLDIIKKLDSIRIGQKASNWQEAIKASVDPLIEKNIVTNEYYEAIIKRTNEWGPYYIISDGLAMPHADSLSGVKANGFSLVTLKKPIKFNNDPREVKVLICLAATSAEIHTSKALPQIVAIFENEKNIDLIAKAKTKQEIYSIIKKVNFTKYINQ